MGLDVSNTLSTDSSAAKGIATGKGLEKVKNLETRRLCAQDKIDEGRVVVEKIGHDSNVADILTGTFRARGCVDSWQTSHSQSWKEGIHWPSQLQGKW